MQFKGETWHCFGCQRKGQTFKGFFIRLANEVGIDTSPAILRLIEIDNGTPATDLVSSVKDFEEIHAEEVQPIFPNHWLDPYAHSVPRYILNRGVTMKTVKRWGLGYDKEQSG
jgi:hypothetical protein